MSAVNQRSALLQTSGRSIFAQLMKTLYLMLLDWRDAWMMRQARIHPMILRKDIL
jgi:hypothetical protein